MSKQLPLEIVVLILSFDTVIKFRNGKFMNQLQIPDGQRELLKSIPRIIPSYTQHHFGRLVIFVCKVSLDNFHEIEICWNDQAHMYWWKFKACGVASWDSRMTTRKIHRIH
jgi:hypothetical protein